MSALVLAGIVLIWETNTSHTLKWTFGWKILVTKCTVGGARGYESGTLMPISKMCPSYGESWGPYRETWDLKVNIRSQAAPAT